MLENDYCFPKFGSRRTQPWSVGIKNVCDREFGSYFCRFEGTSAASAIVGGFLALDKTTGALGVDNDGLEAKSWILSKCKVLSEDETVQLMPTLSGAPRFPDAIDVNPLIG